MNRKIKSTYILLIFFSLLIADTSSGEEASTSVATKEPELTEYQLTKQKNYPHYKVEIFERHFKDKQNSLESTKARIIPSSGGSVIQKTGYRMTPDPREFIKNFSGKLDIDGDGFEDLILKNDTGGAHCCNQYHLFSLGSQAKRLGTLNLKDCGENIELKDLNQDKKMEIITCDASFTNLGDNSFATSPFPPAVYQLKGEEYVRADKDFKQIIEADIAKQKASLTAEYQNQAALQIVAAYFQIGENEKAWESFEKYYQDADKEKIKAELTTRFGSSTTETIPDSKAEAFSSPAPLLNQPSQVEEPPPPSDW